MSYIFKKCDIVRVKKVVGDDPSLMRENQVVESFFSANSRWILMSTYILKDFYE